MNILLYQNSCIFCVMIRPANANDSTAISYIYNYYVLNTVVTFEETPVSAAEMQKRVEEVQQNYSWLVWEEHGVVIAYAYAGQWKPRSAYKHTVESSIYLDPAHTGKGIGKQLYSQLMQELRSLPIHAVIGGIAQPNDVSIRLHEALGFKKIGQFGEVGRKLGRWVDVWYWELLLDMNP
jgi:L-amino acid N-acyltransferase YncA